MMQAQHGMRSKGLHSDKMSNPGSDNWLFWPCTVVILNSPCGMRGEARLLGQDLS